MNITHMPELCIRGINKSQDLPIDMQSNGTAREHEYSNKTDCGKSIRRKIAKEQNLDGITNVNLRTPPMEKLNRKGKAN